MFYLSFALFSWLLWHWFSALIFMISLLLLFFSHLSHMVGLFAWAFIVSWFNSVFKRQVKIAWTGWPSGERIIISLVYAYTYTDGRGGAQTVRWVGAWWSALLTGYVKGKLEGEKSKLLIWHELLYQYWDTVEKTNTRKNRVTTVGFKFGVVFPLLHLVLKSLPRYHTTVEMFVLHT